MNKRPTQRSQPGAAKRSWIYRIRWPAPASTHCVFKMHSIVCWLAIFFFLIGGSKSRFWAQLSSNKLKISISLDISQRYHVWVPHFNPRSKKHQVTSPVPFAQKTGPYEAAATANVEGSIGSSPRLRLRLLGMQGDFRLWRSSMIHSWSFGLSCRVLSKLSIWPIKPLYFWRESFGWNRVTNPDPYATQLLIQKLFFPEIPSEIFPSIHPSWHVPTNEQKLLAIQLPSLESNARSFIKLNKANDISTENHWKSWNQLHDAACGASQKSSASLFAGAAP